MSVVGQCWKAFDDGGLLLGSVWRYLAMKGDIGGSCEILANDGRGSCNAVRNTLAQ